MKVMAKSEGFYKGVLRKPLEVFEFEGAKPGKWMVPVEGKAASDEVEKPEEVKGLSVKEIKDQLTAAGVEFKGNASKEVLQALLDETIKKAAPASSGAPDKSLQI